MSPETETKANASPLAQALTALLCAAPKELPEVVLSSENDEFYRGNMYRNFGEVRAGKALGRGCHRSNSRLAVDWTEYPDLGGAVPEQDQEPREH